MRRTIEERTKGAKNKRAKHRGKDKSEKKESNEKTRNVSPSPTVPTYGIHQLTHYVKLPKCTPLHSEPIFCFQAESPRELRINAWLGPARTVSPLHHDRYHNLLAQVNSLPASQQHKC